MKTSALIVLSVLCIGLTIKAFWFKSVAPEDINSKTKKEIKYLDDKKDSLASARKIYEFKYDSLSKDLLKKETEIVLLNSQLKTSEFNLRVATFKLNSNKSKLDSLNSKIDLLNSDKNYKLTYDELLKSLKQKLN